MTGERPAPGSEAAPPAPGAAAPPAPGSEAAPLGAGDASLLALVDRLAGLLERSELTELEVEAGGTAIVLRKPAAIAPVAVPVVAGTAGAATASAETPASRATDPASRCADIPTPMPPCTMGRTERPRMRSAGNVVLPGNGDGGAPCLLSRELSGMRSSL